MGARETRLRTDRIRRVLRHARHFGARGGRQAAQMIFGVPGRVVRARVPGVASPLWVRARRSDVETFEEIFLLRQYELPFDGFAPRHVLDLGANVGYAAVYFASRWPRARVVAVEPVEENFWLLEKNTDAWPNVMPQRAAVWTSNTQLEIVNPQAPANAYRMGPAESPGAVGRSVAALTIAELSREHGDVRWDLVKMDVEGAEAEILRRGTEWLDQVSVFVIELHDRTVPGCAEALWGALQGRHYRMEIIGSNLAFDFRRPQPGRFQPERS